MAEEQDAEKVFPATQHKRMEARKRGEVARSPELSGAFVLLAMIVAVHMALGKGIVLDSLEWDMLHAFSFSPHPLGFDMHTANDLQHDMIRSILTLIAPPLLAALALGMITNVMQVGIYFTPQALVPDFNRINPATGIKRLFAVRGLVELLKGSFKVGLIGWICWRTISDAIPVIAQGILLPLLPFLSLVGGLLWSLGVHVCSILFVLAVADYAYQKYEFEKNMRMTREEMRQEIKQSDGDPKVKQRIRQRQRAMATKRMMQQVPKADVVVTNPTHFAVALKYDPKAMTAPKVVAKGQDYIAQTIKEIARDNNVPMVENRLVARALYSDVPLGREVPAELYQAVAEILAFVYRTARR